MNELKCKSLLNNKDAQNLLEELKTEKRRLKYGIIDFEDAINDL